MSTTDREDYYDSDLKAVAKDASVDFLKLENCEGKDIDEEEFEKRTMWVSTGS
jgi:hypothetical protein